MPKPQSNGLKIRIYGKRKKRCVCIEPKVNLSKRLKKCGKEDEFLDSVFGSLDLDLDHHCL